MLCSIMTLVPEQMPRYSECRCQSKPPVAFVTHEVDEVNLIETLFLSEPETSGNLSTGTSWQAPASIPADLG